MSLALLLAPQLVALQQRGYEIIGVSSDGPYVSHLDALGIRHIALRHASRAMVVGHDALALVELRALFRRLRPDIVHTHNPKPGIYGRLAARAARVPIVVNTVHGLYALRTDRWKKRALVYGLERLAVSCSDAELVQNPEDLETLARLGVARRKLHLLGNGVDLATFSPYAVGEAAVTALRRELGCGPAEVLCAAVGRLVWEKGYAEVFAAAANLRRMHSNVRFVVVGPADPDKSDRIPPEAIERAKRDAGITFVGSRDDMPTVYAAMDLFVLASYREGFSRSAMEAAAMGVPIVTVDVRGCRDTVEPGVTGLIVPPRDARALAGAIAALAVDNERRRAMGDAGHRKAQRDFDDRRLVEITASVYSRLLGERAARSAAR